MLLLAAVFSTPDIPPLSAQQVAAQDPMMLVRTELDHLALQDPISSYGPPYNNGTDAVQSLGPFSPQTWAGVQIPIRSRHDEVIVPLERMAVMDPAVRAPLHQWRSAPAARQLAWVQATQNALPHASILGGRLVLPSASPSAYGPVPAMANDYLALARSGLLEAAISGGAGPMPVLNPTKALLLLENQADTAYASKLSMLGENWGVIKETGNYPGAVWLWYYTLLYQIPPYNTSSNADLLVVLTVLVVTGILMLTPFIPGLRDLPRFLRVYRWIWRDYYKRTRAKTRAR